MTSATINNFTFNLPTNAANVETLKDDGTAANSIIQLLDTSGTMVSTTFTQPDTLLTINGGVKTYRDTGDSGQPVLRSFCPECGSPITSDAAMMPGLTMIKAGTLDDTSWLDPRMHVYCSSAWAWTPIPKDSQTFAKLPG